MAKDFQTVVALDTPLITITKDLSAALAEVTRTKDAAVKAQAILDGAQAEWQTAVDTARALHAEFQQAVAAVVPGVKL